MNAQPMPRAIDREELGRRIQNARTEMNWSQRELAERVNMEHVNESFISGLELAKVAFREPTMFPRVEEICKLIRVEIPWIDARSAKSKALVIAKKQPVSTDAESKIEDGEVTAIYLCNRALSKLTDEGSIKRVIAYLQSRYTTE